MPSTAHRVSPARACAYEVLRRVEDGAWADRALQGEARRRGLDGRDRALATQLAFGAVQRQATLDHVIAQLSGREPARLDAPVRAALRLGLYQLLFLERVPAHAAVTESVELVKAETPRAAGFVNAVLRRAGGEAWKLVAALTEGTPEDAALKHSHPAWIARLWWERLGADDTRALMAADNRAPEPVLRANTLRTTRDELAAALPVASRPADGLPEALVLEEPFDSHGSPLWDQGAFMPQSRAAQAVARILGPEAGERVLDLCAAPGGKTTHLAALMGDEGAVTAVERDAKRAEGLARTARRMGATIVDVRHGDAAELDEPEAYDRVLVDPPCSDLGTLALRPDARWRKTPEDPPRLAKVQRRILAAGARALRPGGVLVYSTCTISPAENEELIAGFLAEHDAFALDPGPPSDLPVWDHPTVPGVRQTLPHRDGTDGFFVARLRKAV
jgi:16S rRNA (cytosine967-C5)-methyltransferase